MQAIVDAVRRPLPACVLVALALIFTTEPALADRAPRASAASEVVVERGDRGDAVRQIQRALGISADGVFGAQTERAVKAFQRRKGLADDGVVGPLTRSALGLDPFGQSSVRHRAGGGGFPRILRLIAECESGGNPRAVSPGGQYRGLYQFSVETWRSLGGQGDPADAPKWLQHRLAHKLYRQSGTSPWPNCP